MNSSWDKKGIFFSVKLLLVVTFLVVSAEYLPKAVLSVDTKDEQLEWSKHMTAVVLEARQNEMKDDESIKLGFVGDIMLDRGTLYKINKEGDGDYGFIFAKISDYLKKYDILFGNIEGPISDKGYDGKDLYSFRMNPEVIPVLKEVGFNVLSVANNHIFNWRQDAMEDTFIRLSEAGIAIPGGGFSEDEAYSSKIIDIKGLKIGFISFSEFGKGQYEAKEDKAGIALISEEKIKDSISKAKEEADLVVATFHFGTEYSKEINSYQEKYARLAVDSGADLVVGNHPHVVQKLEKYKNTYIAYSLGNFVFDQYFSNDTMTGGLLEVTINSGQIKGVILRAIRINNNYQPELI